MEIKNVLITGSNGYIGWMLSDLLCAKKFNVLGLDTFFYKNSFVSFKKQPFKTLNKDLRFITESDLKNIDAIVHLAALSNDPLGELLPSATYDINYKATVRLAKLAKKNGVKRFIFSSSCSIYGAKNDITVSEKSAIRPITAYAKSKILAEKALTKIADESFHIIIMRNSTVYGFSPKLRSDIVVNNLVASAIAFNSLNIFSDGKPWRALIDVRDLCEIIYQFLTTKKNIRSGSVYNVGFMENNIQVKNIVSCITKVLNSCKATYQNRYDKKYDLSYKVNFSKFHQDFPEIKQKWPLARSIRNLILNLKKSRFGEQIFASGILNRTSVVKRLCEENKLDSNLYWIKE
jgi:nucleoside-diphosphate-sugar epimerase